MLATLSSPLADRLREHTQTLHVRAERTGVIAMLLRGTAPRSAYAMFLANQLPIYDALEQGLTAHRNTPGIAALADASVYRAASLESDLRALAGSSWRAQLPLLPPADRYARRIAGGAAGAGDLLIAHAYVRYLGDLSGGRILKRVLAQTLQLGDESLRFYDFPGTTDVDALKLRYRAAIDAAGASLADVDAVLNEAAIAFELSIELSQAVATAAGG